MRKIGVVVPLVAALFLLAGCGKSPEKVFKTLRDAAAKKDAKAIWANITPETQKTLAAMRAGDATAARGADAGLAELTTLTNGLEDMAVEYIKTLRPGQVTITGDTALMSLGSARFGPVERTLTFRKVDGNWMWDGRDTLKWYLDNHNSMRGMEGFF